MKKDKPDTNEKEKGTKSSDLLEDKIKIQRKILKKELKELKKVRKSLKKAKLKKGKLMLKYDKALMKGKNLEKIAILKTKLDEIIVKFETNQKAKTEIKSKIEIDKKALSDLFIL